MKQVLRQLSKNKFVQGGALLTTTNFLVGFLNYLFNSLAGKGLGPAKYSEIVSLFSYFFILSVPTQIVTAEVIRRLGQYGKNRLMIIHSWEGWFWQRIFRWSILLVPYFLLFIWLPQWTNLSIQSSLSLLTILLFTFLSVFYSAALLGLQLIFYYSIILLIPTIIKLAGPVLVLFGLGNLNLVLFFLVGSVVIAPLLGKLLLQLSFPQPAGKIIIPQRRIKQIIFTKSIFIILITAVTMNLLINLDVIFVKKFFSAKTAGLYGAWNLYAKIIYYVIGPLLTTSFVFFSAKEEQKNHRRIIMIGLLLFSLLTGFCCLFYRQFSDFTILFIFNQQYLGIKPLLPLAALFGCFYCIISFLMGFFVTRKSLKAIAILPFIVAYPLLLFFFGKGLTEVVNINILISSAILIAYLILIFTDKSV